MVRHVKTDMWKRIRETGLKFRYPILILCLGLALLLLPGNKTKETKQVLPETEAETEEFQLGRFTEELEALLSDIQGAGQVRLQLTLESDGTRNYLSDSSQRPGADGTETETQAVLARVDGDDQPITLTRTYPTFRGAVVLCQGASAPSVELSIKEALSSLTGLGMDKITVLTMN